MSCIVIEYYFATQNNILCVIGYKISKEFIPLSAVFNTAEKLRKINFVNFFGSPI